MTKVAKLRRLAIESLESRRLFATLVEPYDFSDDLYPIDVLLSGESVTEVRGRVLSGDVDYIPVYLENRQKLSASVLADQPQTTFESRLQLRTGSRTAFYRTCFFGSCYLETDYDPPAYSSWRHPYVELLGQGTLNASSDSAISLATASTQASATVSMEENRISLTLSAGESASVEPPPNNEYDWNLHTVEAYGNSEVIWEASYSSNYSGTVTTTLTDGRYHGFSSGFAGFNRGVINPFTNSASFEGQSIEFAPDPFSPTIVLLDPRGNTLTNSPANFEASESGIHYLVISKDGSLQGDSNESRPYQRPYTATISIGPSVDVVSATNVWVWAGNLHYAFEIRNKLPADAQAELYWMGDQGLLGSPIAVHNLASGSTPQLIEGTIDRATIGSVPLGARYITLIVDKDNVTGDLVTENNSLSLELPRIAMAGLQYNEDRNASLENATHRGIDFSYEIWKGALYEGIELAFYWGDELGEPLTDMPVETRYVYNFGMGLHQRTDETYFGDFNTPALWGSPPAAAKSIVAVIDPNSLFIEANTDPLNPSDADNRFWLELHSASEVMKGAVQPTVRGATIEATFMPGRGHENGPFTISEAEIALGVEHFNWRQQVVSLPSYWQPITITGIDYSELNKIEVRHDANGNVQFVQNETMLPYRAVSVPFNDSIETFPEDPYNLHTRAFIIDRPEGKGAHAWLNHPFKDGPYPDDSELYFQESCHQGLFCYESEEPWLPQRDILGFIDSPAQAPMAFLNPSDHIEFETRLAGVRADGSVVLWEQTGWNTNFVWKSNAISEGTEVHSGSARLMHSWGVTDSVHAVGGGVFDVKYEDGTLVPSSPVSPSTYLPWHNLALPEDVNVDGQVTLSDAALTLAYVNQTGSRPLFVEADIRHKIDTSGDQYLTPLDVLRIIISLNSTALRDTAEAQPEMDGPFAMDESELAAAWTMRLFDTVHEEDEEDESLLDILGN